METATSTQTATNDVVVIKIKEHAEKLLETLGYDSAVVSCSVVDSNSLHIAIEAGEEGRILIGPQGTHLVALQYIIRAILRRNIDNPVYVSVDVNGYRDKHEQQLQTLAKQTAQKAIDAGRTIVLPPMSSSDRRIVHSILSETEGIQTESLGEDPNRRVLIRPVML